MGLKGDTGGCKAVFQEEFAAAFRGCPRLSDVRQLVGTPRAETLAVLDGNVMVMQVPQPLSTFREYVQILVSQIAPAIEAAAHVVVVFDEPQAITRAKAAEQALRDARRKPKTPVCSADLTACPQTDDFDSATLLAEGCNVRLMQENHRATRPRLHDALCAAVLAHFVGTTGHGGGWSLTFDGIDARGADRPAGERRVAGVISSDADFWAPLLARATPIGEGDLKLTDVTQRVHDAALVEGSPVEGVVLNLVVTIDTDSFLVELAQQAKRAARATERDRSELTVVCFRETARKRKGDDFVTPTRYLCCDMRLFHREIVRYLFGGGQLRPELLAATPDAIALLTAALACCGCDFLEVKGCRADMMLPVVRDVVRRKPQALEAMHRIFGASEAAAHEAERAVQIVLDDYAHSLSTKPRFKRAHASASTVCDAQLLRAVWVAAYWNGREFKDCHRWGFAREAVAA
jgi:hypothetical protein